MEMTDSEIVRSYKEAAQKNKQIGILAELNDCPKDEIKAILARSGVKLRGIKIKDEEPVPKLDNLTDVLIVAKKYFGEIITIRSEELCKVSARGIELEKEIDNLRKLIKEIEEVI